MPMKTAEEVVDMLSELQTTLREERPNLNLHEAVYMEAQLRALRYVLGLEDTLSDTWRQSRIPEPPRDTALTLAHAVQVFLDDPRSSLNITHRHGVVRFEREDGVKKTGYSVCDDDQPKGFLPRLIEVLRHD